MIFLFWIPQSTNYAYVIPHTKIILNIPLFASVLLMTLTTIIILFHLFLTTYIYHYLNYIHNANHSSNSSTSQGIPEFSTTPPVNFTPFHKVISNNIIFHDWSSKSCRQLTSPPCSPNTISPQNWNQFWHTPMHHWARNLIFRIYHDSLPTAKKLYHFKFPNISTPLCRICHNRQEDINHFLFLCPNKQAVWTQVWNSINGFDPCPSAFLHFLTTGDPPLSYFTHSNLILTISYTCCLAIWRAHWDFIFNNSPFIPKKVAHIAIKSIHSFISS